MVKKTKLPETLTEWLTVVTLLITISASLYGGLLKPYFLIRNLEVKVTGIDTEIRTMSKDLNRLMEKIFYKYY